MTDESLEWETIANEGLANYKTYRMRVSGGYIYRYIHNDEAHLLFIPDCKQNDSKSDELPQDLEQRFDELRTVVFGQTDGLRKQLNELSDKVARLYKYVSDCDKARFDADKELRGRIEKLESIAHSHLEANQWREEEIVPLKDSQKENRCRHFAKTVTNLGKVVCLDCGEIIK